MDRVIARKEHQMDPVASSQFLIMKDSFARAGINIEAAYTPDGEIDYMYVVGRLLARRENVERLQDAMPQLRTVEEREQPNTGDLVRLSIDQVAIDRGEPGSLTVPELLDILDDHPAFAGDEERPVTPVHIVHIQPGKKKICPAVEPEVPSGYPSEPWPPPNPEGGGHDVIIGAPDTGVQKNISDYPWLTDVGGEEEPVGPILPSGLQRIPKYAGHGMSVASVAKCMAPGATVYVNRHFTMSGGEAEDSLIEKLEELIQNLSPHLLSLSAGVYTRNDVPPTSFIDFYQRHPDLTLVAAAGNESTNRPFYPAAFEWAVGVGALAADQRHRAWFSNYGDWVDVYALGEGMVNAYAIGEYTYQEPPKQPAQETFYGMARWDGTSFSTPLVAGLIADEMTRNNRSAEEAWQALLAQATVISDVGPALFPPHAPPFPDP